MNDHCREISISNREGKIGIVVDDDKIWVNLTGENKDDTFGIKYTTHVRANRKGIVAHTAVSTGANMPLGIVFERSQDSTAECFQHLLKINFERNGSCDMRNVEIAIDRGYSSPQAIFDVISKNGANFMIGTTKHIANWPFTYDQWVSNNDKHTVVDSKGPPTLFVKSMKHNNKSTFATAFRNGSTCVSTAVSSIHCDHHWEGIAYDPMELKAYQEDNNALKRKCINRIASSSFASNELESEKNLIEDLLTFEVDPVTVRQGENLFYFLFSI